MFELFAQAHLKLADLYLKAQEAGNINKANAILGQMDAVTAQIRADYNLYADITIRQDYLDGLSKIKHTSINQAEISAFKDGLTNLSATEKIKQYDAYMDGTFSVIHREAIEVLVQEAVWSLDNALASMKRNVTWQMAELHRERIQRDLAVWLITGDARQWQKDEVVQGLQSRGVVWFTDRWWRTRDLQRYGDMIVRTERAKAYNTGHVNMWLSLGITRYRRIENSDCCPLCVPRRDKVRDVAKDWPLPFMQIHPNCRGIWSAIQ